jgi:hypothetical protein
LRPSPALANHGTDGSLAALLAAEFDNRGQCESARKQFRNDVRRDPAHDNFTNAEINEQARTQAACERQSNGKYMVVLT